MPQYKIKSRSTTEVSLVTSHVVDDYADLDVRSELLLPLSPSCLTDLPSAVHSRKASSR